MQNVDPSQIPAEALAQALDAIRPRMTTAQLAQLEDHYRAAGNIIPNDGNGQFSPVIMYYGKIGGALTKHLQMRPGKYQFKWLMIDRPNEDNSNFNWHLLPNIVEALAKLGWFPVKQRHPETIEELEHQFRTALLASQLAGREARLKRLATASEIPLKIQVQASVYLRNPDVVAEVLFRANGKCESCAVVAPFLRATDASPYLEVHHLLQLSKNGKDSIDNAVALCPNCHRERHYGKRNFIDNSSPVALLSNEDLSLAVIPSVNADIEEIGNFALAFDG